MQPWARAWAWKRLANRSPQTNAMGIAAVSGVKKVWTLGLPGDYPRLPGSFTGRLRRAREVGGVHASLVTSSRETLGRSSIDLANTKSWTPQARAREARGKGLSRGLGLVVLVAKDVRARSNPSRL